MLLSLNWLREFVPYEGSAEALGAKLTMLGLELEDIQRPYGEIADIIIGEVVECERHPDADKLSVCKVNVGDELLNIVCGAPNVAKGQKVPVATIGVKMPEINGAGGFVIKKTKLRGQESCGMICSKRELGLSNDHSGIYVLPADSKIGTKLVDFLNLNDEILDISITPNRADCLSILGLAREVALAYNLPLTMPNMPNFEEYVSDEKVAINIQDPKLCPSYLARILSGVKVAPSVDFIAQRLQAVGVRPISNIVDITNYILMELGQPLHAFDLNKITGQTINVALAQEGEKFTALDGQTYTLKASDLTIRDSEKAVALAGVMGGQNSEVGDSSTNILLEGAVFNPSIIRKTARRLALHSESSYRFERGIDQVNSRFALNRATALMCQYAGGKVLKQEQGYESQAFVPAVTLFRVQKAADLLGVELKTEFCENTLKQLGCQLNKVNEAEFNTTMPSWRHDLEREVDLIEEIGRVYGVDLIPPTLPSIPQFLNKDTSSIDAGAKDFAFLMRLRTWASGSGLNEAINYSFVGHKDLDSFNLAQEGRVSIKNPLNAELDVLRTDLMPGMMNSLRENLAQAGTSVRLFELAHCFEASSDSETTVKEQSKMAILLYGSRSSQSFGHSDADYDYLDIKGYVEKLLCFLNLEPAEYKLNSTHSFLLPAVEVSLKGQVVGLIGQIKTEIADQYHARKAVWVAELNLEVLAKLSAKTTILFKALPTYPAVKRDITFICPLGLKYSELYTAVVALKRPLLEHIEFIDVFSPEDKNERNLTIRLTFRHAEKTLKDTDVDKERETIVNAIQKSLGLRV